MSKEEIYEVSQNEKCVKVSRHNLPEVIAKKLCGGTTVAATMLLANLFVCIIFYRFYLKLIEIYFYKVNVKDCEKKLLQVLQNITFLFLLCAYSS